MPNDRRRVRIVVEMQAQTWISQGACRRAVEDAMASVEPVYWRRHGILPSSVAVKRYSMVVAAEYGVLPTEADREENE